VFIRLFCLSLLVFGFIGCSTVDYQPAIDRLSSQVNALDAQIARRDAEIQDLRYEVSELSAQLRKAKKARAAAPTVVDGVRKVRNSGIIRISVDAVDVQKALANSGYYNGKIDGKVGNGTKKAIAAFQKDHGLKSDGIIGLKTWSELKNYLE